ncbi:MAG: class I SAM-dependent methyltransferase [Woeseiaceae bacterium]
MSSNLSTASECSAPQWMWRYLGVPPTGEGQRFRLRDQEFIVEGHIPRSRALLSEAQTQTLETFGFKWHKRDTFESVESLNNMRRWLTKRYGDIARASWLEDYGPAPLLVDAGCGAAMSAIELLAPVLPQIRYFGIDVSRAVDVARSRFTERGFDAAFMQADITKLPFREQSVDLVFSEGVLHHTDSTRGALEALSRLLKRGGRILFYVYRRKGPIREFTDDYVREKLQSMSAQESWDALMPLTKLGKLLSELDIEIDIAEAIDVLGIPAGRISLQRFFYWNVFKAYYRPELTLDEMNHINFDWYAPRNAWRQSSEEVLRWCAQCGLVVERHVEEEAGITVIARKA